MKKEDQLKHLIRHSGPEQPEPDFTSRVMLGIESLEVSKEKALIQLLTSETPETAPEGFTQKVMAGVSPRSNIVNDRSREKLIRVLLAAAALLIFPLLYFSPSLSFITPPSGYMQTLGNKMNQIPLIYPLTVITASVLLWMDFVLRKKTIR